jgi:hypothetical protein
LRHNALVYDTEEEYLATAVTFLRDGLLRGEGAVVGNTGPGIAALRDALGPEASRVTFVDVSTAYTRPARTLASTTASTPTSCAGPVHNGPSPTSSSAPNPPSGTCGSATKRSSTRPSPTCRRGFSARTTPRVSPIL